MNSLLDKLKKYRQSNVELGGFIFTVQRPTQVDFSEIPRESEGFEHTGDDGKKQVLFFPQNEPSIRRFVVGWQGVNENDIVPNADPTPAVFDVDLLVEWLKDRHDIWNGLALAIWGAYSDRNREVNEAEKKPVNGSATASPVSEETAVSMGSYP